MTSGGEVAKTDVALTELVNTEVAKTEVANTEVAKTEVANTYILVPLFVAWCPVLLFSPCR